MRRRDGMKNRDVIGMALFTLVLSLYAVTAVEGAEAVRDIRNVDFRNYTYTPNCFSSLPDSGLTGEITTRDGVYRTGEEIGHTFFEVTAVHYADLNEDGQEEAIVDTNCGFFGANYVMAEYFIFGLKQGTVERLACINNDRVIEDYKDHYADSFTWPIYGMDIDGVNLVMTYHADGAHCCPEYEVKSVYRLSGRDVELIGKPERKKQSD
jgi:hypothetical protein